MLLSLTHMCFPRARRHARKFFELSYYNPDSGAYRAGWNDAWMVFFWIVVFTGLRAAVMEYILTPLAKKGGVKTERDQTRFAEQARSESKPVIFCLVLQQLFVACCV